MPRLKGSFKPGAQLIAEGPCILFQYSTAGTVMRCCGLPNCFSPSRRPAMAVPSTTRPVVQLASTSPRSGRCSWLCPGTVGIQSNDSRTDRICVCLQSRDICRTRHYMNAASNCGGPANSHILGGELRRVASGFVKQLALLSVCLSALVIHDESPHHSRPWHHRKAARSDHGPMFRTGDAV